MLRKVLAVLFVALAALGLTVTLVAEPAQKSDAKANTERPVNAPRVTVARAAEQNFVETVLATGSLVPREEILVGPEVEGLRVTEVLADEGMRVKKGDVLARLVVDTLEAQVAQNDASLARTTAAIAQARSNIVQAEAKLTEAKNAFERAKPLLAAGHMPEATYDQRQQAALTAEAQLVSARDGLKVAEAEKAQVEAQRREIEWRRGRSAVVAPADGIISRRVARIGGFAVGSGDAMFRIVAKGEVELDAEVTETRIAAVKVGQKARVEVTGVGTVEGTVRLVSPEVDKTTRLGRVRIFLGDNPNLRVGTFARASIATAEGRGLAIPSSAVLYVGDTTVVQVVRNNKVETRKVELGLVAGGFVEVRQGLEAGDTVVARSGTFLRDGDAVDPVLAPEKEVRS
ncbi:MAG: efflux RND transporter periplasmic adaptor subunit [Hyphomicrobiales bacterium]|nr:MAG: efflux RND transporter periplasmic adaptor subunit [Hyphomicrobiales bacterium]